MTLILSERELQIFSQKKGYASNLEKPDSYELVVQCPKSRSRGYKRSINLRYGLNLLIRDYQLQESLVEEILPWESSMSLEFGFNISGKYRDEDDSVRSVRQSFLEFGPTPTSEGFKEWSAGQRVLKVDLHLTAPSTFGTFSSDQMELIPPKLRQIVENVNEAFHNNLGSITPATQLVLQQILNCPYKGWTQQIYLESKALELIVLQSAQVLKGNTEQEPSQSHCLRPADVDRIYQARDLLIRDLDNPPSLLDLARQVGINDCTLKRSFRQVFGTTVFGYLRSHRMMQARQLLVEGEMSVTAVAIAVGYSHPGYFAAAFKQEFGVNPKSFRQLRAFST